MRGLQKVGDVHRTAAQRAEAGFLNELFHLQTLLFYVLFQRIPRLLLLGELVLYPGHFVDQVFQVVDGSRLRNVREAGQGVR